jgi:hypothetical protein
MDDNGYKIKGSHREAKRESARLKRLNPGSYATSGMHQLQEIIIAKGRKAQSRREKRNGNTS